MEPITPSNTFNLALVIDFSYYRKFTLKLVHYLIGNKLNDIFRSWAGTGQIKTFQNFLTHF